MTKKRLLDDDSTQGHLKDKEHTKKKKQHSKEPKNSSDITSQDTPVAPSTDFIDNAHLKGQPTIETSIPSNAVNLLPFMDTFYQLSVEDPNERSRAASHLLHHVFFSQPNISSLDMQRVCKDGLYALTRLVKGLASSRVYARIGFSTCLTSFLQMSFHSSVKGRLDAPESTRKTWIEYFMEHDSNKQITQHPLAFVRNLLLQHTAHKQDDVDTGKSSKKRIQDMKNNNSDEEKDLLMGRLLGISAIVRSGILLSTSSTVSSPHVQIQVELITDLLHLYSSKPWLREPSIVILIELFSQFDPRIEQDESTKKITSDALDQLFTSLVTVSVFVDFFNQNKSDWTLEKIALVIHLQTIIANSCSAWFRSMTLPTMLQTPILTVESLTKTGGNELTTTDVEGVHVASLLASSNVHTSGSHIVWDVILASFTMPMKSGEPENSQKRRMLRSKSILGDDTPEEVLEALMNHVIVPFFISDEAKSTADPETKHDIDSMHGRQLLTLSLVQKLCCSMVVPTRMLEFIILQPTIARKLFTHSMQGLGRKGGKKSFQIDQLQAQTTKAISDIVETVLDSDKILFNPADYNDRRLAVARALLRANPSFDAITHTSSVSQLLDLDIHNVNNTSMTQSYHKGDHNKKTGDAGNDDERTEQQEKLWNGYISFLLKEFISYVESSVDTDSFIAVKIIDTIFQLGKRILRMEKTPHTEVLVQHILDIFIMGAFFNLKRAPLIQNDSVDKNKKKSLKKMKTIEKLPQHLEIFLGAFSSDVPVIPENIRNEFCSRYFSLILDTVTMSSFLTSHSMTSPGQKIAKSASSYSVMQNSLNSVSALGRHGLTLANQTEAGDQKTDPSIQKSMKIVEDLISMMSSLEISGSQHESNLIRGFSVLIISLHLQLLVPTKSHSSSTKDEERMGYDESDKSDDEEEEEDDDDLREDILDYIVQLHRILKTLLNPSGVEETNQSHGVNENEEDSYDHSANALSSLASTCISLLSSFGSETNATRGASCKLMKECAKITWGSSLSYAHVMTKDDPSLCLLNEEVLDVVLQAVCLFREESYDEDDEDDPAESLNEEENDPNVFVTAASADVDLEICEDNMDDDMDNDESELFVDDSGLQKMLLEDSDEDVNDSDKHMLEHHAGADKALAQLIRMKQQARKAGRVEQERLEISHRLRCFPLLEAIFSLHSQNSTIPTKIIVASLVPLLKTRRDLDRGAQRTNMLPNEKSTKALSALMADKRALVGKIDSLLQGKITKIKGRNSSLDQANNEKVMGQLFHELRKKSHDSVYTSIVSLCMILILKSTKEDRTFSTLYSEAVHEWSTKASSKISTSIFQDLISRCGRTARLILTEPLINATENARTSFLKAESYLLLSSIYHEAVSQVITDNEELDVLKRGCYKLIETTEACLEDAALIKSKRIRNVLKALEKIILFGNFQSDLKVLDAVLKLSTRLDHLKQSTESSAIKDICRNVMDLLHKSHETVREKTKNIKTTTETKTKKKDCQKQ